MDDTRERLEAPTVADDAATADQPEVVLLPLHLRIIRRVGWTFITVGLLILGFVVHQLWVTTYFAARNQDALEAKLVERTSDVEPVEVPFVPGVGVVTEDGDGVNPPAIVPPEATGAILSYAAPPEGEPIATLRLPSITGFQGGDPVEWTFVEGVRLTDLKSGAGHMPATPLPGLPGNSVISGHRTTYGAPFHNLDLVMPGDRIYVDDPVLGTHVYEAVSWSEYVREFPDVAERTSEIEVMEGAGVVVRKTALWVTDPRPGAWLTLTTCHPKWSAARRLVVFAKLIEGPNAEVILSLS